MNPSRLSKLAVRQKISSEISERLEKRYREEWIDSQGELNVVIELVCKRDPRLKDVKIIQTFHQSLDVCHFLEALAGSDVRTVAFVGINMDEEYSLKLARALSNTHSAIACLQLCRIYPTGLENICPAFSNSKVLKELRLTFNHDLSLNDFALLTESLSCSAIEIFKLYCVDLQDEQAQLLLADAIIRAQWLTDLRITSCNMHDIWMLATAIRDCNRLNRVDLSMNKISDINAVSTLWEVPSIEFLSLSQNELGLGALRKTVGETKRIFESLALNKTLKQMQLDMNPLSHEFINHLTGALKQNTTLMRLGILTLTVSPIDTRRIRYLISLNCAGRGKFQRSCPNPRLLPYLFARVSNRPEVIYGLLTRIPHVWIDLIQEKGKVR